MAKLTIEVATTMNFDYDETDPAAIERLTEDAKAQACKLHSKAFGKAPHDAWVRGYYVDLE